MEVALKDMLNEGIVTFTFTKKNGEIRQAKGSRRILVLKDVKDSGFTEDDVPTTRRNLNDNVCAYWDFDKKAWRSVRLSTVISIDQFISEEDLYGKNLFD